MFAIKNPLRRGGTALASRRVSPKPGNFMNRWQRMARLGGVVLAALALAPASAPAATTGWNQTTGSWTYSDPANWVNNTINGQFDSSLQVSGELRLQFPSSYNFTTALVFNHNPSATPLYLSPTAAGRRQLLRDQL